MQFDAENDARLQTFTTCLISLRHQQFENEVAGERVNYVIRVVVAWESLKIAR